MNLDRTIELANEAGFLDITSRLKKIKKQVESDNAPIVLPLVGEFSSGKTSLINALTDGKALETSTKPTTSTIYEVHFGSTRNYATVKNAEGAFVEVDDIGSLNNERLSDADYVKVYDTSTKIPDTTLLIDTPGLSSSDPRHRQALVSFLPEADGIMIVMDVNAQLVRSTIDFINSVSLSSRPIYLILTKCDTKSKSQVQDTIHYIKENHNLPFRKIVSTSASTNDLEEIYTLLDEIQKEKKSILANVNEKRVMIIISEMISRIDTLLAASVDDDGLKEAISKQRLELRKVQKSIDRFFEDISSDIETAKRSVTRDFEGNVFTKLDTLVAGKSSNFDAEALSIINNNSTLALNNLKAETRKIITERLRSAKDLELPGHIQDSIDFSDLTINGLSYNLNLNEIGHEYDSRIAAGVKIAAAIGVVVATAGAASGAVGSTVAGEALSASTVGAGGAPAVTTLLSSADTIIDVVDTVSDVSSIVSNRKSVQDIQSLVSRTQVEYDALEQSQQGIGQRFGSDKGIVESVVGLVTEATMGKPQRRRAIHDYIDSSLIPTFKSELNNVAAETLSRIKSIISAESAISIGELTQTLETLLAEQKEKNNEYEARISSYRKIRKELLTL